MIMLNDVNVELPIWLKKLMLESATAIDRNQIKPEARSQSGVRARTHPGLPSPALQRFGSPGKLNDFRRDVLLPHLPLAL
jgi:hypothetical protein